MKNVLLLAPDFDLPDDWIERVETASGPGVRVVLEGELPDDEIEGAIVDNPPPGRLNRLRNLKLVLSLSAGIDSLLSDPLFPTVPLIRIVPPAMVALMREYVCYHALRIHRNFPATENLQRAGRWEWLAGSAPATTRGVLVLGLGALGAATAEALSNLGFRTFGFSQCRRNVPGVTCIQGTAGLHEALTIVDIVVCLLPLTPSTTHFLRADLFLRMRRGSSIVNAGRGQCLREQDLLDALNSQHLSSATLDVFVTEPLPSDHPFWTHPQITITPHLAAYPQPHAFVDSIAGHLSRFERGECAGSTAYRDRGY